VAHVAPGGDVDRLTQTSQALAGPSVVLGGYRHDGSTSKAEALERAEALRPILNELAGMSTRAIAAELNARGIKTAQGQPWTSVQILRVRGDCRWVPEAVLVQDQGCPGLACVNRQ
jgi:hypothetical protein